MLSRFWYVIKLIIFSLIFTPQLPIFTYYSLFFILDQNLGLNTICVLFESPWSYRYVILLLLFIDVKLIFLVQRKSQSELPIRGAGIRKWLLYV